MAKILTLPTTKCLHCGHVWVIRVLAPRRCPNCKSANYLRKPMRRGRPLKVRRRVRSSRVRSTTRA